MERRARGYFEVRVGRRTLVTTSSSQGLELLAEAASEHVAGIDLGDVLRTLFRRAPNREHTADRVGVMRCFHGVIAVHEVDGMSFLTWDHPGVVRGIEVLGRVEWKVVEKRAKQRGQLVRPGRFRSPHHQVNAANVRPWRPLPDGCVAWLSISKVRFGDVVGAVRVHRWAGPKGVRWLVTFDDESDVFGEHRDLRGLLRRMRGDDPEHLEIHPLFPADGVDASWRVDLDL